MHWLNTKNAYTLAAVAMIASGWGLWTKLTHEPAQAPKPLVLSTDSLQTAMPEALQRQALRLVESRLRAMPEATSAPEKPSDGSPAAVQEVATVFREMEAFRGLYNQGPERAKRARQILELQEGKGIVAQTLLDPKYARTHFGHRQAQARYFAAQVIKEAALSGEREWAGSVARDLTKALADKPSVERGRKEDLYDVLGACLQGETLESLERNGKHVIETAGYSETLPGDLKSVYEDALRIEFWRLGGVRCASDRTRQVIDG